MASANPNQLFLLADHIKLSLLERQRAISLNLEPSSQDGHISRSLDSLREGIETLELEQSDSALKDQSSRLRIQYDDLTSQFRGFPSTTTPSTNITQPNNSSLKSDFIHAQNPPRPSNPSSSSFLKRSQNPSSSPNPNKSVRFRDSSPDAEETANRAALFPYRDDPSASENAAPDQSTLDNQQIHAYHSQVLRTQDEQLDRLGESIGRQRDLSIQIGDELDDQVQMLDEIDGHVDRHQGRLDGARKQLGKVAKRARDNKQVTTIVVLIIVLVFLIVILKN